MKRTIEYFTDEEREIVLNANLDLTLIEEQNITEGNFLIFSDMPLEKEIVYMNVPKVEYETTKEQVTTNTGAIDFIIMNF